MLKKILIIDDDLYIRELYEELLKDEGFEVDTAVDGLEGLEKIKKGGFDLILLDIMMPKLDGLSLLDKLSQHPPIKKNGPIILLTNLSHDPVIKEGLKKGACDYVVKAEITPDQLITKVKKIISPA